MEADSTIDLAAEELIAGAPKETQESIKMFMALLELPDYIIETGGEAAIQEARETAIKEVGTLKLSYNEVKETIKGLEILKNSFQDSLDYSQVKLHFMYSLIDILIEAYKGIKTREEITLQIELISDTATIPTYANDTDAGADVYASEDITIPAGETVIVKTGLKVATPIGYALKVYPRSGMSYKTPIRIANSVGIIDTGYRDEVGVICHNTSPGREPFEIKAGDRIAQFILEPTPKINFEVVKSVKEIGEDRKGGFGSSGQ